ncbi:MAG: transcriptional regulator, partial [Leptolyngbya sp. DLM2.Bin15]
EPTLLILQGEPGIGKTRLLEELSRLTQEKQVKTLWGQGFAAEKMRPYGIWIDALRGTQGLLAATAQLPADLGLLLPELGQPSQRLSDLSHLLDAVVQLLMQWAQESPLLIVLDDIQWMDDASSALLHYAVRRLRSLPVWIACSARVAELVSNTAVSQVLQALRREQQLHTFDVVPLDREQTAELLHSTIAPATLSLDTVNQVFIDSGGNPLFALEIARALSHTSKQPAAQPIEDLIRDRLQQLDETARDFLPWAAALGRSFQPTTVAQIADYPMIRLLTAIEQLEQQALIRPSSSIGSTARYDFAHDIVRQVVYQQLSEPRRQLMHWQIAQQLQQRAAQDDTLVSEVAYHAGLAGDHSLAASSALAAAERCLRVFAYTEALDLTHQGLHHSQFIDPSQRLPLQGRLRWVQVIGGMKGDRADELEADIQTLITEANMLGFVEAEAIALEALIALQFERSNYGDIPQHTQRVAEASQVASPATAARMLAQSGSCLAEIGREMHRAEALLGEAQSLADRVGLVLSDLVCGLGCVHRHHGRYAEARSLLQQALHLARGQQNHWLEGLYLTYLAMTEIEAGHPEAALPYCHELTTVAAKIQGDGSEIAMAKALERLVRYHLAPNEAASLLIAAIQILEQVDAKRMIAYVLMRVAFVDLAGDRFDLAAERAKTALANAKIVNQPSFTAMSWALWIQSLAALGYLEEANHQWARLQTQIQHQDLSQIAQAQVEKAIAVLHDAGLG